MFSLKRIAGFFVLFLVFYGLLMAPWPGVREAYAAGFRAGGSLLFGSFGAKDNVRFRPLSGKLAEWDTEIILSNPQTGMTATIRCWSWRTGFVPTAVLISLVLATPLSWARKTRALAWGLLLINGYVALRLALVLLHPYSPNDPLALFVLSPLLQKVLTWIYGALNMLPGGTFGFPVLLWILATFRRSDWRTIFPSRPTPSEPQA
ncbi:MAG: hypothetical protein V2A79_08650 [Planctomycetota bacterium]